MSWTARGCLGTGILFLAATQTGLAGTNEWTGGGFEGGAVNDIERDPTAAGRFFAGTVNGPFRSTDGGASWVRMAEGANRSIADLAIAADGVLYALDDLTGGALLKSTDGGASWAELSPPAGNHRSVAVARSDSARVTLLASESSDWDLYLSTDGGASFALSETGLPNRKNQVVFDPENSLTVYCATEDGVYRSTDGGATWTPRNNGGLAFTDSVAVSESAPAVLLSGDGAAVAFSSDAGASWTVTSDAKGNDGVWIAPSDATVMAAIDRSSLYTSSDGGASWQPPVEAADGFFLRSLAFDASNPDTILAGSSTLGIRKSTDGGGSWSNSSAGMNASNRWNLSARSSATVAYDWGGSFKTTDGGTTWTAIYDGLPAPSLALWAPLAVDATDADHAVWIDDPPAIFETTDGGASWQDVTSLPFPLLNIFSTISMDPQNAQRWALGNLAIDLGGEMDPLLAFSLDGGGSWSTSLQLDPDIWDQAYPWSIRFSPDDANVILVTGSGRLDDSMAPCWVQRSTDGGATWTETFSVSIPVALCISELRIDPVDPQNVYLAKIQGGTREIYRSTDNGQTWSPLTLPAGDTFALAVNPIIGEIYVGGDALYRSTDGGATWQPFPTRGLTEQARFVDGIDVSATDPPTIWISTNAGTYSWTGSAEIFADGFESGDTSAWSNTVP
jgi:photosystem II stability/assembly factor-like uncharacterized protein